MKNITQSSILSQSAGVSGSILTVCANGGSVCRSKFTYGTVNHSASVKIGRRQRANLLPVRETQHAPKSSVYLNVSNIIFVTSSASFKGRGCLRCACHAGPSNVDGTLCITIWMLERALGRQWGRVSGLKLNDDILNDLCLSVPIPIIL